MPYPQRSMLYYRNYYRKLSHVALFQTVILVCLLGLVFFQIWHLPKPVYFATTTDGRVIPIQKQPRTQTP